MSATVMIIFGLRRPISAMQFDPFASPWSLGNAAAAPAPTPQPVAEREDEGAAAQPFIPAAAPPLATDDFRAAVTAYERAILEQALKANRFNQRATAAALSLSYDQLRHALKRHGLMEREGV